MAYTLPFVSANSQKLRGKLRLQYNAQTDPMFAVDPPPMIPNPMMADIFGRRGDASPIMPTETIDVFDTQGARPPSPSIGVPTPSVQPAAQPDSTIMAGDESAFLGGLQDVRVYDPSVMAGLEAGGMLETQREAVERERVEKEVSQFESRLNRDSEYLEDVLYNAEREAAGLEPRPLDAFEAIVAYDKEVLDPIVYALLYGGTKLQGQVTDVMGGIAQTVNPIQGGYGKGPQWELERRVDELRSTSVDREEARALGIPYTASLEGAIRQAAEEEIVPWYITEPLKVIADPAAWPVGGVPFVRGVVKLPTMVGNGAVRLKNAGASHMPLRFEGVAEAQGRPFLSGNAPELQRNLIDANRAFFDVPDFDYRLVGNGRIEIVGPEEMLVRANASSEELFGIPVLKSGLSGTQRLMSEFKQSNLGQFIRGITPARLSWMMTPENNYVTPAMEAWVVGVRNVKSIAAAVGRNVSDLTNNAFDINPTSGAVQDRALLEMAADYDVTLMGNAPTISDIAARLPYYWDAMTPTQREAIEELRVIFGRVGESYTASGYPKEMGTRADVMTSIDEIAPNLIPPESRYIVADLSPDARKIQGFYIPRGEARVVPEKMRIGPLEVARPGRQKIDIGSSQYQGAPDFTKPEEFGSMSEAMAGVLVTKLDAKTGAPMLSAAGEEIRTIQRYKYNNLRDTTTSYVQQVGEAVWEMHLSNYLKNLINPATGEAFAIANTTRIPKPLRARWTSLKNRLSTARESNRRILNQMVPIDAEIARLVKDAERRARASGQSVAAAAARAERARLQAVLGKSEIVPIKEEMRVLHTSFAEAETHLGEILNTIKTDRKLLSGVRKLARPGDRQLAKLIADAEVALDDANLYRNQGTLANVIADTTKGQPFHQFPTAGSDALQRIGTPSGSWEEWFGSLERIADMRQKIDDLAAQSDSLHAEIDDLISKGALYKDEAIELRGTMVEKRRALRTLNSRDREIALAKHEYKMLDIEQGRLERLAAKDAAAAERGVAGARARKTKADTALAANKEKIQGLSDAIDDMSDRWHNAVSKARGRADTGDIIPLAGLGGYYFPDAMANAARVFIAEPGMKKLFGQPAIEAFNQLYRGARGTLDNSRFLIQMLLRHYDDPRGMLGALRMSYHAFGVPGTRLGGESAIDSFFRTFDDAAKESGRLNSRQWARHGLVITGADTEFQLGGGMLSGLGRLPLISNANRAFGALGDYARLTWADDLVEGMLKKKSLDELIRSGDLEDIAQTVNNASGWAPGRFGGSLGDLVLFAPRFLQSRLNTLGRGLGGAVSYATKPFGAYGWESVPGSVGQRAATRSIFRMLLFGTMMTVGINEMQGRKTDFYPVIKRDGEWVKNPNFMRFNAFGRDVSPFGTWDSLLGMAITSTQQGPHQAVRSMASGVTRNVWDFSTGESFEGERTRDTWGQGTKHALENITPFVGDDLQEHADHLVKAVAQQDVGRTIGASAMTFGTLHGLKSAPMSLNEELTELRLDRARDMYASGDFDADNTGRELSDSELDTLYDALHVDAWFFKAKDVPKWALDAIDNNVAIGTKKDAIEQHRRDRGSDVQVMLDEGDALKENFHSELDDALAEMGVTSTGEQRVSGQLKDALRDATTRYSIRVDGHRGNHVEVIERFDRLKEEDRTTAVYNQVREDIFTKLYSPDRVDALGRFDSDGYQADEDKIRADYDKYTDERGNNIVDSVFANIRAEEHPLQTRWREAKDIMEPWFNVPDQQAAAILDFPLISDRDKNLLRLYIDPKADKKGRDIIAEASRKVAENNPDANPINKEGGIISVYNQMVDAQRNRLRNEETTPGAVALNRELVAWDLASLSLSTMRLGNIQGYIQNLDPQALEDLIATIAP